MLPMPSFEPINDTTSLPRVQVDVEAVLIPIGDRFAEFRHAGAVRIAMVDGFTGAFQELFDDSRWGGNIGITDPKIDQINAAR